MSTTTKPSDKDGRVVLPVDLRDYFAAKAMQAAVQATLSDGSYAEQGMARTIANNAYIIADAMLAAREASQRLAASLDACGAKP